MKERQLHLEEETRNQWSERKYRVNLNSRDMMNNAFHKCEGLA